MVQFLEQKGELPYLGSILVENVHDWAGPWVPGLFNPFIVHFNVLHTRVDTVRTRDLL